jgi:hypothetical protein
MPDQAAITDDLPDASADCDDREAARAGQQVADQMIGRRPAPATELIPSTAPSTASRRTRRRRADAQRISQAVAAEHADFAGLWHGMFPTTEYPVPGPLRMLRSPVASAVPRTVCRQSFFSVPHV